jgi:lysophospholipase L1-like esterase
MTIQSNALNGQVADWTLQKHTLDGNKDNFILYHKKVNEVIRNVARENNSGLVDIAETFKILKATENKDLFYRPEDGWDDIHPNEVGHAVIAGELFKYLSSMYL